jgi:hypothetical protein
VLPAQLWQARKYALTRLRQVGNTLRSPEQAEAFSLWARAWHLTVQLKAKLSAQKNNAALYAAQLRGEQMEARIAQLEGELLASIEERRKLRERISELDGGAAEAQRLHEEQLAKEKEVRVGQLAEQAPCPLVPAEPGLQRMVR